MTDGFDLKVKLSFDREQSCIEFQATFEKDFTTTTTEKLQRMFVRFYADAVDNPSDWQCSKVVDESELPPELATFSNARKYFKMGELFVLDLEYIKTNVNAEGLNDGLQFTDATKLRYVDTLRHLLNVTSVKLFVRLRLDEFPVALEALKRKMR